VSLVPRDQWDGSATLTVRIDLAGFRRVGAAKASARAAAHSSIPPLLSKDRFQGYYQLSRTSPWSPPRDRAGVSRKAPSRQLDTSRAAAALDVDRPARTWAAVQQLAPPSCRSRWRRGR